jgi:hypothetical protein
MTEVEKRLWYLLRRNQFEGVKFKRQVPIGPYIVDFAFLSSRSFARDRWRLSLRLSRTLEAVSGGV